MQTYYKQKPLFHIDTIRNDWYFLLNTNNELMFLFPFWKSLDKLKKLIIEELIDLKHMISLRSLQEIIVSHMQVVLLELIKRVLVWEFNLCYKKFKGLTLKGFLKYISSDYELNILFNKYCMLKNIFYRKISNYSKSIKNLLLRIKEDLQDISEIFHLDSFFLKNLVLLGDSHSKGTNVILLEFCNLDNTKIKKIIYKPRDLNLEKSYNNFLNFLKKLNSKINLKVVKIISKNKYGWMEYIQQKSATLQQAKNYYYNIGLLLGICYLLNAQDIHYENLIASGADPVIIDLECLLSPPINMRQYINKEFPSISDTLILPFLKEISDLDLSAILNHSDQKSFMSIFTIRGDFKRKIYIKREILNIVPKKNILINKLNTQIYSPTKYYKEILKGYGDFARTVIFYKPTVKKFIIDNFSKLKNRVIFRPTFIYNKLLLESYHPKLLSNRKMYINYLEQLYNLNDSSIKKLVRHEIVDLLSGDIPLFTTNTDVVLVKNSRGFPTRYNCLDTGINRIVTKFDYFNLTNFKRIVLIIEKILRYRYD